MKFSKYNSFQEQQFRFPFQKLIYSEWKKNHWWWWHLLKKSLHFQIRINKLLKKKTRISKPWWSKKLFRLEFPFVASPCKMNQINFVWLLGFSFLLLYNIIIYPIMRQRLSNITSGSHSLPYSGQKNFGMLQSDRNNLYHFSNHFKIWFCIWILLFRHSDHCYCLYCIWIWIYRRPSLYAVFLSAISSICNPEMAFFWNLSSN